MSDYPDPEEEYELMYADEFELMRENEENDDSNVIRQPAAAKRSLDFSSPASKKPVKSNAPSIPKVHSAPQTQTEADVQPFEELPLTPQLPPLDSQTNCKRTVDDLFGDINDIDFGEQPAKKQKTDEEKDQDLINKILECRKIKQILSEPVAASGLKSNYSVRDNISLDIPRWAFMPLTNSDSDRMYVKLIPEEAWDESLDVAEDSTSFRSMYSGAWDEAKKMLETKKDSQTHPNPELSQLPFIDVDKGQLWVDKYRPKSYVELLSDETVNRAVLHWLHLWDKVVFKKEYKPVEPEQRSTFNKRAGQFYMTNKWKGKKETEPELEEDGRPRCKIALLYGPPGVGKTTLAHLLAKLAGYRPVEINASDERSTDAFKTALQSATLMRSVLDVERRPNCLILDEIDGAPLPTIEFLVRWVNNVSSKKKDKVQPLKRPIIAICNDLYAPALRPLRPISKLIRIEWTHPARLSLRLRELCSMENVIAADNAILALANKAGGDVRAAVAVLAFTAMNKKELTMKDVLNSNIGSKDCSSSVLQALQAIFNKAEGREAFEKLVRIVSSAGDYDRIMDGIFENYLSSNIDSRLLSATEVLNNLRMYDFIMSHIQRTQNYTLYGMLPILAAKCGRKLAKVKYPSQGQEMYRNRQELDGILWSIYTNRAPAVMTSRRALLLDVISLLPYVLAPRVRTGNVQLCSELERKALRSAAATMCDYGINYIQQRTEDGLYAFVLQPDLYKLAFYGTDQRERPPPNIRQALASEQQLEHIRRCELQSGKVASSQPTPAKLKPQPASKEVKESHLPNHLQTLRPKEIDKCKPTVHKDFFGRVVPILESSQRADAVRDLISSSKVFYQYQEGFNNAVRRSVRVRDML